MVEETQAFLRWLRHDHFTFLGYTEYDLVTRVGVQELYENPGKRLGLFRLESSPGDAKEIGRASCRERVGIVVVEVTVNEKDACSGVRAAETRTFTLQTHCE